MMTRAAVRGFAGVSLLASIAIASGCGTPPDESLLRIIAFEQNNEAIGVFKDTLSEESTETVDVKFENGSSNAGLKSGTGVFVNRTQIDYRMAGYSPPSAEFLLNFYLEAPADGKSVEGTLTDFPLAPASLKRWISDAGVKAVVELTAHVTFYGETDDGARLETEGDIEIALAEANETEAGDADTVGTTRAQ